MKSENDICAFSYGTGGWDWLFSVEIPRSVWEPQLRAQIEQAKAQLAALDEAARRYVDAALT
jgi:hypothetical protein